MVIHHFNRLIRNKWIWGAFAVAISAFFAFDFMFTGSSSGGDDGDGASAGSLDGETVSRQEFFALRETARRNRSLRGEDVDNAELNRRVWGEIAAYRTAQALSIGATDVEIAGIITNSPMFKTDGVFDFNRYKEVVARAFELTPEGYEDRLRRDLAISRLDAAIAADASWVSPAQLDLALRDLTDTLTIRLVTYTNALDAALSVTDEDIRAYYDANAESLALPDCATVRFVKIEADTSERLAKFDVSDDEIEQYYEDNISLYETTTQDGTVTKPLDEVKGEIVAAVKLEKSMEDYRTDLSAKCQEAVGTDPVFLDKVAAMAHAKVETSPVFALDGAVYAHFTQRSTVFAPGATDFVAAAGELDATNRWNIAFAPRAVYVMEYETFTPAHTPSFEEAVGHDALAADALREKKAKVFKEAAEAAIAPAAAALKEGKAFDEVAELFGAASVSTSLVFTASRMMPPPFPEVRDVYSEATELSAGELSAFIPLPGARKGYVVYMEKRENNNAEAMTSLSPVRMQFAGAAGDAAVEAWTDWNLKRMNLATRAGTAIDEAEPADEEE